MNVELNPSKTVIFCIVLGFVSDLGVILLSYGLDLSLEFIKIMIFFPFHMSLPRPSKTLDSSFSWT